jgi:hypothetical protein
MDTVTDNVETEQRSTGAMDRTGHGLFARHLCPACPTAAKALGKSNGGGANVAYCCPKVRQHKAATE